MSGKDKRQNEVWIEAGEITLEPDEILLHLKLTPHTDFLAALLRRKLAAAIATKRGIVPDPDEIEAAEAELYTERDLFEEQESLKWSRSQRLDQSSLRAYAAESALVNRARRELITDSQVEERFAAEHYLYARVDAYLFEFSTEGQAREFMIAVRENEFAPTGGARKGLIRREVAQEIAGELFSTESGGLVGPVGNEDGSFGVFQVEGRIDPILDEELREEIRDALFDELLDAAVQRAPARFLK